MTKSKFMACVATAAITVSALTFMAACHKTKTASEDTGYASDQAVSEKSFEDAQTVADQGATTVGSSLNYRTTGSGCATITRAFTAGDSVITIDFGTSDCLCHDGSYRRGQIIVTYAGAYATTGSTHTITFNNFYQNDNQITGTKTVTNMGQNSLGQTYFNVTINGSVILANGEGTLSAVWNRTRTWVSQGTPNVYNIYGTGTLTRANGTQVSVAITSAAPLVVSSDCRWIEAGTVTYTLPSGLTRTLNYGNTAVCDDEAVLTLPSGATYNITLK